MERGSTQNYRNHVHRPVLFALGLLAWLVAVGATVVYWFGASSLWLAQGAGLGALLAALLIGRLYITALQDRIIRLEMRMRGQSVLSPAQMTQLGHLSKKHVAALRFASDAELPALVERAATEHLTPDAIKRAVTHWIPDHDRT